MTRAVLILLLLSLHPAMAEPPAWMPPGAGQEETANVCGVCHGLSYIRMNSRFLKPDAWQAEVDKMRKAFGAPIDDATAAVITSYVTANFGVPAAK